MSIQRRINHTGRRRIEKSRVDIRLEGDEGRRFFGATVNFQNLSLPADAPVYIEAYQRYALQRFACGTVDNFSLPPDTGLRGLDVDLPIRFRVKVVDRAGPDGRLLAAVKGIRATNEQPDAEGRERLLPVVARDLGDVPWRVDLERDCMPQLAFNNRIPGCIDRITHDASFQGLVFPSAIRTVLSWIYWREMEDSDEEWVNRWLMFAHTLAGDEPPKMSEDADVENWIECVVMAFSRKHRLTAKLADQLGGAGE